MSVLEDIKQNKRIGILSHYHDTTNYGGALQAYALCQAINQLGYESEQIDVDFWKDCVNIIDNRSALRKIVRQIKPLYNILYNIKNRTIIQKNKEIRDQLRNAFSAFIAMTPHSGRVYTKKTIADAADYYDIFITGSDQVWNPIWFYEPFFLSFVPNNKSKIAYAASVAQSQLSEEVKQRYKKYLEEFDAISVRERSAVELISETSSVKAEYVLDPTLLLDANQWDSVASKRLIEGPYVLCYFLADNKTPRMLAEKFSENNCLALANIMHATGQFHKTDLDFGDIKLSAPSPQDFLSLIKYADAIFTDSFHAVVFSHIFQRQYFVFNRDKRGGMSSRITDITQLFGTQERFCFDATRETVDYIESCEPIKYTEENRRFEELKAKSIKFLKDNFA